MGLTIGEVEVGQDYRLSQSRVRALGIDRLEEHSYYGGKTRNVRYVRYVPVDTETGERDGREEKWTLAKNLNERWDRYIERNRKHVERNAPRVAGEKKVKEAIESLFLFEGQPEVRVMSNLRRRYYSDSEDLGVDAKAYLVEVKIPDVFVDRFVRALEVAANDENEWPGSLPVPEVREEDG